MNGCSFEAAVTRHQRTVFTFAAYHLGDRAEAEDVTQEVLLRLWRNPRVLGSSQLRAWLLKVTRNACTDLLRRRTSRARIVLRHPGESPPEAPDSAPGPEDRASAEQLGRRLRSALDSLREPHRSIVVLREIQGLSYREIAAALELPLTTVKVTLHRARRRLREQLREEYDHAAAV
jgi:RNA polymerase sigma-70 factor (ECF subfamily)